MFKKVFQTYWNSYLKEEPDQKSRGWCTLFKPVTTS